MYRLFYNHENVGDVLFIVIKPGDYPDKTETKGEVTALFKDGELVGYNLFDFGKTVKIKASGMIVTPDDLLLDVINDKLANAGFEKLPYCRESGYVCAEVTAKEEHPLDEQSSILTLNAGETTLSTVTRYQNIDVGTHIVVALDGCIKFDGTTFSKKIVKNIPIECEVCSGKDLHVNEDFKSAQLVPELAPGADFFLS